jgi:ankyrin repeat protein
MSDPVTRFLVAACVPRDAGHASGVLEGAEAILAAHPEVANTSIHAAAVLGDAAGVRRFLAQDPQKATAKGGPHHWDALTHLCFSRYLRIDRGRSAGFVGAATALLDAGASANTGWLEASHEPHPEWESALYGAAGVAQHPEMTRLLLERGADPNDEETPYHVPESYDNTVMKILVEHGKLNDASMATLLLRKTDWHDYQGIKWLLENGADANFRTLWGKTAFHNAVISDNSIEIVELLLAYGADPTLVTDRPNRAQQTPGPGKSAVAMAAERGRGDVLRSIEKRGFRLQLEGVEQLIAACAKNDEASVRALVGQEPELVPELVELGGKLLAQFAGVGNTEGVRRLLDLGVSVGAVFKEGEPYFDIANNSTALHAAAWRARPSTVKLLLARGAAVDAPDGKGRTALMRAVGACVDSYWMDRRSPESVEALLEAGASADGLELPCGYPEVDRLFKRQGA